MAKEKDNLLPQLEAAYVCIRDPRLADTATEGLVWLYRTMQKENPSRFLDRVHAMEKDQRLIDAKEREAKAAKHAQRKEDGPDEGMDRCLELYDRLLAQHEAHGSGLQEAAAKPEV